MRKPLNCANSHEPPTFAEQAFAVVSFTPEKIFEEITGTSRAFLFFSTLFKAMT